MSIRLDCICGSTFEADEGQIGQTVKCVKCGSLHRVHGPRPAEPEFAKRVSPLNYRPAPTGTIDPGEALARIGWRVAAGAAVAIQVLRLVEAGTVLLASKARGPTTLALFALVGLGCGSAIVVFVAVRVWLMETWARWVMLVLGLIQAVALVFIGQTPNPPVGPMIWFAGAAAMAISWILLLERPTNTLKLTVGMVLAVMIIGGLAAVSLTGAHS